MIAPIAGGPASAQRREELRHNLADVRGRIAAAAAAAGRPADELTLIAVSKNWPASDVALLSGLGVTHFAENREQEARLKVAAVTKYLSGRELDSEVSSAWQPHARDVVPEGDADQIRQPGPAAAPESGPCWHFVGQLQRNKARPVAGWAHWVQSVDRAPLVNALAGGALSYDREIAVCLQVSLDPAGYDTGRGGVHPADILALGDLVAASRGLVLVGVMGVAPRGLPAHPAFARLREVSDMLRREHPDASVISAGMSADFAEAVAEGATHLRIGTALFGPRRGVP
ncbi:YggS family pyridoxal phosphate enzyme [Protofrankia symbiont of Coriaria ruscifolia]|uniref:Pyridoxal phosphate homeostasis protein n=1 Tax=Candidatus Protofrankia californiensis TaxID=1839754 RepID=A0A1C3P7D6_9ACTN|nr:alanine racemase [Protofrankia symbiont of Coriaria ruscifolia]SBW25706.1 alanine racemase domain-containing protein [Candidatus Protofrankia californiensis]